MPFRSVVENIDMINFQSLERSARTVINLAVTPIKFKKIVIAAKFPVDPHS
jgi:hypothetical protein